MRCAVRRVLVAVVVASTVGFVAASSAVSSAAPPAGASSPSPASSSASLPGKAAPWHEGWASPALADRPLRIVHGIRLPPPAADAPAAKPTDADRTKPAADDRAKLAERAERYVAAHRERGLGGIVCNMPAAGYMHDEAAWQTLEAAVEACRRAGMIVWIYDEEGYPSGAAGGLVLKARPELEARELAFDASRTPPFVERPSFEFTHASNNYAACRRYVNLLDAEIGREFLATTHEAYRRRLGKYFGSTIQAFFTDEPSFLAVNLGLIPEPARSRVRVVDPVDPSVKSLPAVPWSRDLVEAYRARYGEDLLPRRASLFGGTTDEDRRTRRRFWSLAADLTTERYYGAIQAWCRRNRVASSGHVLHEESLIHHPAVEGNTLQVLAQMDIPGMDMLTSDPEAVVHGAWVTAALPGSAAVLNGGRRVMTEVSDFSEKMSQRGPAPLDAMRAAAAYQAAWGVTEFTLYYEARDRSAADDRAYGDFIGRLNAVLKPARVEPEVLLYYPIEDLWAEYVPTAEPLRLESQSARAQRIVQSFRRLGSALQRNQIPFILVDPRFSAQAEVKADGTTVLAGRRFRGLVVPDGATLSPEAARIEAALRKHGGAVWVDAMDKPIERAPLLDALRPAYRLTPPCDRIVLGKFRRDGREVVLLVNVGREAYQGRLAVPGAATWRRWNPATGAVEPLRRDADGSVPLAAAGRETILLTADSE